MDESIQKDLLSSNGRHSRRLSHAKRQQIRPALVRMEQEGPPLREQMLVAIASRVRDITSIDVSEDSLRNLIEDAGLVPPPKAPARVRRSNANKSRQEAAELAKLKERIREAKRDLQSHREHLENAYSLWNMASAQLLEDVNRWLEIGWTAG